MLEPLFDQNFHSLFSFDLFVAVERAGETGQTTRDNQTTVITTKLRQTVDEIQRALTRAPARGGGGSGGRYTLSSCRGGGRRYDPGPLGWPGCSPPLGKVGV